jgi:isoquinoline 1-oxidoreductase beta subunit
MADKGKKSRREFIRIFSIGGSGLILASYVPLTGFIQKKGDAPKIFAPNAFIKIDSRGLVTVIVPKSELGQGVFTSLTMLVAEELEVDWEKIKVENAYADKKFGDQNTGGSTSVRRSWEPLRVAGATAKAMLVMAAAARWKVASTDCAAEMGFVVNKITGKRLAYGELVEDASKLPIPTDVKLKDPKDYKIIGKKIHRLDTPDKLYGQALFGIDHTLPGMYHATVSHFPTFGGGIKKFATTKTKSLKGVIDVADISTGIAVIAESTWLAFKGKGLLSVDWEPGLNANLSSESIHKTMAQKLNEPGELLTRIGNAVTPQANEKLVEAVFETPFLAHAPMEPMNCLAHFRDGKVEIWAPTQNPQGAQSAVAKALGLKEEDVTVYVTFSGGGFGRRGDVDYAVEAAEISKHASRPIKLTWTREEDIKHDFYRPPSIHQLKGTLDDKGEPVSLRHHVITPSIEEFKSQTKLDPSHYDFKGGAIEKEYLIPYVELTGTIVPTPVPIGYWRSVYRSQNPFALESFIDEMALAAKRDPFEFRRDMLPEKSRLRNVLTIAAQRSDWYGKLRKGQGRGIACATAYDSYCAFVAEVTLQPGMNVKVDRFVCAIDCGLVVNPDTVEAQMQSCVAFALSAALKQRITVKNGGVVESNFDSYPILTYDEMPKVDVHIVQNSLPVGGIGELGIGVTAPALCNAIYAATGKRVRVLPVDLRKED